jgi:small subunit ribosomal protein S20
MPIIKSAKKRVRIAKKATVRNNKTKKSLKTALKAFHATVSGKKAGAATKAQSALDKAAKKKVMHKNKVARKQRQLAKAAKAAGVKPTKKTATKAAPKKTAAKKPAAKKPAAKKTTKK